MNSRAVFSRCVGVGVGVFSYYHGRSAGAVCANSDSSTLCVCLFLSQSLRSELDVIIGRRLSDPGQTDWRRPSHERDVLRSVTPPPPPLPSLTHGHPGSLRDVPGHCRSPRVISA